MNTLTFSNTPTTSTWKPKPAPHHKCPYNASTTPFLRRSKPVAHIAPKLLPQPTIETVFLLPAVCKTSLEVHKPYIRNKPVYTTKTRAELGYSDSVKTSLIGKRITQNSHLHGFTVSDVFRRNGTTWAMLICSGYDNKTMILYRDIKLFENEVA